jgi:hypothetical protein
MTYELMFRSGRTRPTHARSSSAFRSNAPECSIEALTEKLGDMRALLILDESKLAIAYRACDSGKHLIELGQIFV